MFQNLKLKQTFYVFSVPAASIMATMLYNPFHKQVIALEAASDPPFSVFTLTTIGKLLLNLALWADGNLPFWICINMDLWFMATRCFKPRSYNPSSITQSYPTVMTSRTIKYLKSECILCNRNLPLKLGKFSLDWFFNKKCTCGDLGWQEQKKTHLLSGYYYNRMWLKAITFHKSLYKKYFQSLVMWPFLAAAVIFNNY